MSYKIINNLSPNNHGQLIKSLIKQSDHVIIASPFLFPNLKLLLEEMVWDKNRKLHLITTLPENSEEQFKKINTLMNLSSHIIRNHISCRVSIDNSLHGKLYIFGSTGRFFSAIISSANCTNNGFYAAREWGVQIFDELEITALYGDLIRNLDFDDVKHADITRMHDEALTYKKKHGAARPKKVALKLTELISGMAAMKLSSGTNYFLKPIGHSKDHVKPSDRYDHPSQTLHFAKTKPKDIKVGDIFIAFAVGSGRILSIYRMKSTLQYTNPNDRWPWYIHGDNLTIGFGKNWWENDLTKEALKVGFDSLYPGKGIKPPWQDQGFGAFQYGRDRMKITEEFGRYIIAEVFKKIRI